MVGIDGLNDEARAKMKDHGLNKKFLCDGTKKMQLLLFLD